MSHTFFVPPSFTDEQVRTGGDQVGVSGRIKWRAVSRSVFAFSTAGRFSPSALLMAMPSAISRTPFLMPWSSSPAPAIMRTRKKSTMEATLVSDWPTPTVSTRMTSNPAASQTSMISRVLAATPPKVSPAGEGRIKAFSWAESFCIRVLSPRMEPPERRLEGSTASTATLWP